MEEKKSIITKSMLFERLCGNILEKLGYTVLDNTNKNVPYDFEIIKCNNKYLCEVTYTRNKEDSKLRLLKIIENIKRFTNYTERVILITSAMIHDSKFVNDNLRNNVFILDIRGLFNIIKNDDILVGKLEELIDFSTETLLDTENLVDISSEIVDAPLPVNKYDYDLWIKKLKDWNSESSSNNRNMSTKYEELCCNILQVLFSSDLTLWKRQEKSFEDLYRFDLICRIKDDTNCGFWNLIENQFHSKYIIFESKNYSKEITQKEIYTTEKYLYLKSLRSVAFIISNHGASKNAEKAIKGCLRENGKLIISLSNDDLIEMLNIKNDNQDPSEYLYDILDKILIELEK